MTTVVNGNGREFDYNINKKQIRNDEYSEGNMRPEFA